MVNIKNNIFIMTRDLITDYHWVRKPTGINDSQLISLMERTFNRMHNSGCFTSEWFQTHLTGCNMTILFRIVVDGRTDEFGRLIRRYEVFITPVLNSEIMLMLEASLKELQDETNNFGYGYQCFAESHTLK